MHVFTDVLFTKIVECCGQGYIKMSSSESRPRKVELTRAHSKKRDDYREYFTYNNEIRGVSNEAK